MGISGVRQREIAIELVLARRGPLPKTPDRKTLNSHKKKPIYFVNMEYSVQENALSTDYGPLFAAFTKVGSPVDVHTEMIFRIDVTMSSSAGIQMLHGMTLIICLSQEEEAK